MTMTLQRRGFLSVFGGFLVHLVLGTLYYWANITIYVISYLRYHSWLSSGGKLTPANNSSVAAYEPSLIVDNFNQLGMSVDGLMSWASKFHTLETGDSFSLVEYDDTIVVYAITLLVQGSI